MKLLPVIHIAIASLSAAMPIETNTGSDTTPQPATTSNSEYELKRQSWRQSRLNSTRKPRGDPPKSGLRFLVTRTSQSKPEPTIRPPPRSALRPNPKYNAPPDPWSKEEDERVEITKPGDPGYDSDDNLPEIINMRKNQNRLESQKKTG
jgi:hypothetical protein